MSVQCVKCKMLMMIDPESKKRREADQDFRTIGRYDYNSHGHPKSAIPTVICHVGQRSELPSKRFTEKLDMVALLCKEIECDRFEPYVPGIGPEQIDEMNTNQAALEVKEKLLALHESVFAWRREQADRDAAFGDRLHAIGKTQAWGSKWQAIGTILAFLLAFAAFMGWGRH